jgi:predicted O-methyltransferase YrrM
VRRLLARVAWRLVRACCPRRPLPLGCLTALRLAMGRVASPLAAPLERTLSRGSRLADPILANELADDELGAWALDAATIGFLQAELRAGRPGRVLEFGSGVSTILLAHTMAELHGRGGAARVISLEQDRECLARTRGRLERMGLADLVVLLHAPLEVSAHHGVRALTYSLGADAVRLLSAAPLDFVLVDGPAAGPLSRYATLPLVAPYAAKGCAFMLDDALRDAELRVAARWARLPWLEIDGLRVVGKGLLCGRFTGSGGVGPRPVAAGGSVA